MEKPGLQVIILFHITGLTPYILNELIEKIVVHEKETVEGGSKSPTVTAR